MILIKEQLSNFKITDLCWAFDIPRASFYRFFSNKDNTPKEKAVNKRSLSNKVKLRVLDLLNSSENVDKSPSQIYYEQLDKGIHICSISSFYRILRDKSASCERRNIRRHSNAVRPELIATGPNQVWSWDVSKLKGPVKLSYFYLHVIIDIYSKYVVGWMVATKEDTEIAKELFNKTFLRQNIQPEMLIVHSDRGPVMKSEGLQELYGKFKVVRSLNRPYVSNDNPFSEANFKTLKYRPDYPERFETIFTADRYLDEFYRWYNDIHYHSGIEMLTPQDVHYGGQDDTVLKRIKVLEKARLKNPERFYGNKKNTITFNGPVYINKPQEDVS